VLLIIVGGYVGLNYYGEIQQQRIDAAFGELNEARNAQDIQRLAAVADRHEGKAAVASLARIELARLYNNVGLLRVAPGAEAGDELLSADEANEYYELAIEQGRRVLSLSEGRPALAQQARWNIATAQISLGRLDEARETLEEFRSQAERHGLASVHAPLADARLAQLDAFADPYPLVPEEQLPEFARAPEATPTGGDAMPFDMQDFDLNITSEGEDAGGEPTRPLDFGSTPGPPVFPIPGEGGDGAGGMGGDEGAGGGDAPAPGESGQSGG
jgi:tetratricopeptide (TPR) repeat protein